MAFFSICKAPSYLALKIKSKTKAHTSAPFRGSAAQTVCLSQKSHHGPLKMEFLKATTSLTSLYNPPPSILQLKACPQHSSGAPGTHTCASSVPRKVNSLNQGFFHGPEAWGHLSAQPHELTHLMRFIHPIPHAFLFISIFIFLILICFFQCWGKQSG